MTGKDLKKYRRDRRLTQEKAAKLLGVSQTYLSLLESDKRRLTEKLKKKLVRKLDMRPTELPADANEYKVRKVSDDQLTADLAALGYPGFSHYKPSSRKNPADVLLSALNSNDRDARLVEALPWLVLGFPDMNWYDVTRVAKMYDLQNRLGFVVNVARHMAAKTRRDSGTAARLVALETELERSMLAREDTLCNDRMTNAERKWLRTNRPRAARQWHLLTDLSPRYLDHYVE